MTAAAAYGRPIGRPSRAVDSHRAHSARIGGLAGSGESSMDGIRPRRLALAALAALLIVGIATDADRSAASFTATTTSPGNQFTSATLSLSNDKAAAASLISIGNLVPGDTAARTVTITNTGNVG